MKKITVKKEKVPEEIIILTKDTNITRERYAETGTLFYASPTGNCQVGSVAYFADLINQTTKKETAKVLRRAHEVIGKPLLLCDVRENNFLTLQEWFPKAIHMYKRYKNITDSKMVILLINTDKL